MSAPVGSAIDRLAAQLVTEVRDASMARSNATMVAEFDAMTREVRDVACDVERLITILAGSTPMVLPESYQTEFRERRERVSTQLAKLREAVATEPMRVRQGTLWRDTRSSFNALRSWLVDVLDAAYAGLLESFAADDLEVLDTLPPGITGTRDYRTAINEYEGYRTQRPSTVDEVVKAVEVGERLRQLREQVEAESVPEKFLDQWRRLRTTGLPLTELTDDFRAWLNDQGLGHSAILTYRAQ